MMMKKMLACAGIMAAFAAPGKELKVLMIGNSFSICVGKNLPAMVKSVPGNKLTLASAYIGGCSLERHWKNIEAVEKYPDAPEKNAYRVNIWHSDRRSGKTSKPGNVKDLLTQEKWDVITIQQASPGSPFYETYQPWAEKLIAYIKEKAPQAEIIIQQTWAYRKDDGRLQPKADKPWGFTQAEMYDRLTAAYEKLATANSFRQIPVGLAVELTRRNDAHKFAVPTAAALQKLCWPDLPSQASDPVGKYFWYKDKSGELMLGSDTIHLNERGEYLQSCVWFAFLFGIPTDKIAYDSPSVGKKDCAFLRRMAQEAVNTFTAPAKNK